MLCFYRVQQSYSEAPSRAPPYRVATTGPSCEPSAHPHGTRAWICLDVQFHRTVKRARERKPWPATTPNLLLPCIILFLKHKVIDQNYFVHAGHGGKCLQLQFFRFRGGSQVSGQPEQLNKTTKQNKMARDTAQPSLGSTSRTISHIHNEAV